MASQQIINQFTEILRDLLGDDTIILHDDTRRENVPNWDSLNYVNFIMALEMKYHIKFPLTQVEGFQNIGEMAEALEKRLKV